MDISLWVSGQRSRMLYRCQIISLSAPINIETNVAVTLYIFSSSPLELDVSRPVLVSRPLLRGLGLVLVSTDFCLGLVLVSTDFCLGLGLGLAVSVFRSQIDIVFGRFGVNHQRSGGVAYWA